MEISPFVFVQAMLCMAGFPAHMTFAVRPLGPPPEDQVCHLAEKFMSHELMPVPKPKISLMSCQRRPPLDQEFKGATPSASCVILSSKSDMAGVIGGRKAINAREKELEA
jgi:hypothetical protein